jgi:adenosine kinase
MLNKSKNYNTIILGCIGNDNYGEKLTKALEHSGVKPLLEIKEGDKTSLCGVAVYQKERCLVPMIRASTHLSQEYVNAHLSEITQAHLLLIEGYFVIEKYEIIQQLYKQFNSLNKEVAFTLSATFMVENFYDRLLDVCNHSQIIFSNNEEAELFAKIQSEDFELISKTIHKLLTPKDRVLVITCGSKPTVVSKWDYTNDQFDFVLKTSIKPVKSDDIVDTNGAGDAFVGGFLSHYIQGKSFESCSRAGNWAASVIIQNVGCTYPDNKLPQQF